MGVLRLQRLFDVGRVLRLQRLLDVGRAIEHATLYVMLLVWGRVQLLKKNKKAAQFNGASLRKGQ